MELTSFITTVLLALAVAGEPIMVKRMAPMQSLTVYKHFNTDSLNVRKLLEYDQRRAMSKNAAKAAGKFAEVNTRQVQVNSLAENTPQIYIATVGVGSPATQYNLIVDSGSSNTWVGAKQSNPYVKTSTSIPTNQSVSLTYGTGEFSGLEYLDTVTITTGLVIYNQSIGAASNSSGFLVPLDGIMGIGRVNQTNGTLNPDKTEVIPTVTDNLFLAKAIPEHLVSVSFEPTGPTSETGNGVLTWGGIDDAKFTGSITFTNITTTWPSSESWGVDASISYGTEPFWQSSSAGIVDTGTTFLLLPSDVFLAYQKVTGGVMDLTTGLLRITSTQYNDLQTLNFVVENTTFRLTANGQIWPRNLNNVIGGDPGGIYLIVGNLGYFPGINFILGLTFLERFYVVFDTGNNRVGLATTSFTDATTN